MRKRISWGAALSLMIIVVAATVCVTMLVAMRRFNVQVSDLTNRQAMYKYLSNVDTAVRQHYYGTIDEESLRRALAVGAVEGLGDPYARYLTTEEYVNWQEQTSGQNTGYGLEVALDEAGRVTVSNVQMGAAAYSAGMQKGDVITAVNRIPLEEEPLAAVQKALDEPGTLILTVEHEGRETAFELSASSYARVCVEYKMLNTVGCIRIRALTDAAPEQLKAAYAALKEAGALSLVLDLRELPEGSFNAARKILSFLLPYGQYGYYQDKSGMTELRAEESGGLDIPAALLVNENTAGEAELIAAALRQAGLASLVEVPTAGRSTVQDCFALTSDNAAVYITVGEMLLMDRTGWEGRGLTPDLTAELTEWEKKTLELLGENDPQLQAAVTLLTVSEPTQPPVTVPTTTATEGETEGTTLAEITDPTAATAAD